MQANTSFKKTGKQPIPFIHSFGRSHMRFTSLWKGLAIAATLFLIGSEAFAQLPVRTQQLQMLGTTAGRLLFDTPATITNYTVTWPADAAAFLADGDTSILVGVRAAANDINLGWRAVTGDLVDGIGSNGFIAWWQDGNTLTYSNNFAWTGTAMNIGTQNGTAAGNINLGDGAATATTNFQASGAAGDLTLGNNSATGAGGTLVLAEGGAAGSSITIETGSQTAGYTVNFDDAPAAGNHIITPSTNGAGAGTTNYIYVSNGNGTGTWVANPTQQLKSGSVQPAANAYSANITFNTVFTSTPVVTVTASGPVANGYILQVTAITTAGCTILSSAPFDGTDTISWVANVAYNP